MCDHTKVLTICIATHSISQMNGKVKFSFNEENWVFSYKLSIFRGRDLFVRRFSWFSQLFSLKNVFSQLFPLKKNFYSKISNSSISTKTKFYVYDEPKRALLCAEYCKWDWLMQNKNSKTEKSFSSTTQITLDVWCTKKKRQNPRYWIGKQYTHL